MTGFRTYFVGRDSVPESIVLGRDEELSLLLVALPGVSAEISLRVELNGEGAMSPDAPPPSFSRILSEAPHGRISTAA